MKIYAVWDRKAEDFVGGQYSLMMFKHDAPAVRFFGDMCVDPKSVMGQHPEDFDLVVFEADLSESSMSVVISAEKVLAARAPQQEGES